MEHLLLNPRSKAELTALTTDPPHALMIVAPLGMGKRTVAEAWARQFADASAVSLLEPDEKGTITIDATRALYQRTRAKQSGHQVVIIDHAEAMSGEAQNAFLKLLEEPRPGLTFILTTPTADAMLPTIQSRLQMVYLHSLSAQTLTAYTRRIQPDVDAQSLAQLLFMADGRPGLLTALLQDEKVFERQKQIMQRAKQLLAAGQYERLSLVQELSKDKNELVHTLEAMARMLQLHIARGGSLQLPAIADGLQECLRRLRQNGNARAQLVHFFLTY